MLKIKTSFSFFKWIYPSLVWNKTRSEKVIYLTFDDGPIPEITPWVLNELEKYDAKATFFCIGDNVKKNPETYQLVLSKGHIVGNHTNNHLHGWKTKTQEYLANIEAAAQMIDSDLFRPPYGKITRKQLKGLTANYKIIMWDVLSYDYDKDVLPQECIQLVLKNAKNGSIIVFHDSIKASQNLMQVLPAVLNQLSKKGFSFKSLN